MKGKLRTKKLRKFNILNNKKSVLILVCILFITVGFSVLTTTLSITENITVKKKNWDATEVSYTTSKNSSVSNSKQAIDDLYTRLGK